MKNKNPIDFVKLLYEFEPNISDGKLTQLVVTMNVQNEVPSPVPSIKTISVWKSRLRKRGVFIPDKRKRKENK